MTAIKEFAIHKNCSQGELASKVNAGWQIQFMQFMQDGTLHVVFFREVDTPAPTAPVVTVVVEKATPIPGSKLPINCKVIPEVDSPFKQQPTNKGTPSPVNADVMQNIGNRYRADVEKILNSKPRPFGQQIREQ